MEKKCALALVVVCVLAVIFWIDGTVICLLFSIFLAIVVLITIPAALEQKECELQLLLLLLAVMLLFPFLDRNVAIHQMSYLVDGRIYAVGEIKKNMYHPYLKIQELDSWHRFKLEIPFGETFLEGEKFYVIKGKIIKITEK